MNKSLPYLALAVVPFASASGGWVTGAQEFEFIGEAISSDDIFVQN